MEPDLNTLKEIQRLLYVEIDKQHAEHDRRFVDGLGLAAQIVGRTFNQLVKTRLANPTTNNLPVLDILFDKTKGQGEYDHVLDEINLHLLDTSLAGNQLRIVIERVK